MLLSHDNLSTILIDFCFLLFKIQVRVVKIIESVENYKLIKNVDFFI